MNEMTTEFSLAQGMSETTFSPEMKALHDHIRNDMKSAERSSFRTTKHKWLATHRDMLLLWAFVRGLKFRRLERTHHFDKITSLELNLPDAFRLAKIWEDYLPNSDDLETQIHSWLKDPAGAIPAPVRVKKPYLCLPRTA